LESVEPKGMVGFIVEDPDDFVSVADMLQSLEFSWKSSLSGDTSKSLAEGIDNYPVLISVDGYAHLIGYNEVSDITNWFFLVEAQYAGSHIVFNVSPTSFQKPSEFENNPQPELGAGGEPIPTQQKKKSSNISIYDILPVAVRVEDKNEWRELERLVAPYGITWESKSDPKHTQTYPEYFPYFIGVYENSLKHSKDEYTFTNKGMKLMYFNKFKNIIKRLEQ